jgi:NAD+ synthase
MSNDIVNWIKNYAIENKIDNLIVGISGGIDSALVSTLCAMTKLHTIIISLPIKQKPEQILRSRNHAKWLTDKYENVSFIENDLTNCYEVFENQFEVNYKDDLSLANTKSRLRMVYLYQIASSTRGIVVGTGNKIEDFGIGFFTKYGDGGVDISPIADLTKTEVFEISKKIGILNEILEAKPTDGLWEDDRNDEEQIGAKYEELEWAMEYTNSNLSIDLTERQKIVLSIYEKFHSRNLHKMISIPIYKKKSKI